MVNLQLKYPENFRIHNSTSRVTQQQVICNVQSSIDRSGIAVSYIVALSLSVLPSTSAFELSVVTTSGVPVRYLLFTFYLQPWYSVLQLIVDTSTRERSVSFFDFRVTQRNTRSGKT